MNKKIKEVYDTVPLELVQYVVNQSSKLGVEVFTKLLEELLKGWIELLDENSPEGPFFKIDKEFVEKNIEAFIKQEPRTPEDIEEYRKWVWEKIEQLNHGRAQMGMFLLGNIDVIKEKSLEFVKEVSKDCSKFSENITSRNVTKH